MSIWHLLILGVVVMLVFGSKRIPEIGASLGKGIQEFKRGLRDVSVDETPSQPPLPPPATSGGPKRLNQ